MASKRAADADAAPPAKRPRTVAPAAAAAVVAHAAFGVPGLEYRGSWLSADEEAELLRQVDAAPWLAELSRRVQHFGFKYSYSARSAAEPTTPMPAWALALAQRLVDCGAVPTLPDQLIVNEYTPGQGIAAHIDASSFADHIASISLGASIGMELSRDDTKVLALVRRRSLLVFHGESRYRWRHAIAKRKSDTRAIDSKGVVHDKLARSRRVSLTFRKLASTSSSSSSSSLASSSTSTTTTTTTTSAPNASTS